MRDAEKLRARIHRQLHNHLAGEYGSELARELEMLDWPLLARAVDECFGGKCWKLPHGFEPAEFYPAKPENLEQRALYAEAEAAGRELVSRGKVAAFTVAGGQGTRLGFPGPKGTLGMGPLSGKSLFGIFADKICWARRHYEAPVPWVLMCSPLNLRQTMSFFRANDFFGLGADTVHFIVQGVMPVADLEGNFLLADRDSLAVAPDGHGGSIRALNRSGIAEMLHSDGVEIISYFQVDNPLVEPVDPLFIGLHGISGSQMSSRSVQKRSPEEKTGVFARAGGKLMIIEYSDMPVERASQVDEKGRIVFNSASPAIHLIDLDFIRSFSEGGIKLPFHRAVRKASYLDQKGEIVHPEEANAVKFETFVFDAIPMAKNPLLLEADRAEQFSPVKNLHGQDTVETSRNDMQQRDRMLLAEAGINFPDTVPLEIDRRVYGRAADLVPLAAEIQKMLLELQQGQGIEVGETLRRLRPHEAEERAQNCDID